MRRMSDGSLKITEKKRIPFGSNRRHRRRIVFSTQKFMQTYEQFYAVKIVKLKKREENFNRKLLQQYRNKGQKK
jgi:hypothetical protein